MKRTQSTTPPTDAPAAKPRVRKPRVRAADPAHAAPAPNEDAVQSSGIAARSGEPLGESDIYYFRQGTHARLYRKLG